MSEKKIKVCARCVQIDTRPGIYFNEDGVCGACLYQEEAKGTINWDAREKELRDIAAWAKKTTKGNYDCVIGVSGGKDTTFQAIYARDTLGLRPLLVNGEPEGITDIGRYNIENLKQLGFDVIQIRPNPRVLKKMMKRDFYKYLNPVKITEYYLWASANIIAHAFKIPLVIQGENPGLTLGVRNTGVGTDGNALNANKLDTLASGWEEYVGDGVDAKDLFLYRYDREAMEKAGQRGVWLQYYAKEWSQPGNAAFAMAHGFRVRPPDFDPADIGTYVPWSQLDSDLVQVNQMLKDIKFGFGQCMDHACYDIREGRITREQGIELVRKYDGKCSGEYVRKFCDFIEITPEEFWRVVDSFRNRDIWYKENGEWRKIDFFRQKGKERVKV
ncbi:MAG: N-acetyl sugar amidotransferase [Candidatus Omnitrophota bacterium]